MFINLIKPGELWLNLIANAPTVPGSVCLQSRRTIMPSSINGFSKGDVFMLTERLAPHGGMKVDQSNAPESEMF